MAKYSHSDVMDKGLTEIVNSTTRMVACEGAPSSYGSASQLKTGGNALGFLPMASFAISIGNDGMGGRKLTVRTPSEPLEFDVGGNLDHLALIDDDLGRLLFVTGITNPQSVQGGNNFLVPSWEITIQAPV